MTSLGLVVLLFIIVPGFVADEVYGACFGTDKPTDVERTLRSLILSVFGLAVYLWLLKAPPPYLPKQLSDFAGVGFTEATGKALLLHTLFSCGVAIVGGVLLTNRYSTRIVSGVVGRSLGQPRAWDMMWANHRADRTVRVRTGDDTDRFFYGHCLSVSHGAHDKDIVLHDPHIVTSDDTIIDELYNVRLLYIPESQVKEIRLGQTPEERGDEGEQRIGWLNQFRQSRAWRLRSLRDDDRDSDSQA
jgi:hypothetical protein